jgi:hypothetical protein
VFGWLATVRNSMPSQGPFPCAASMGTRSKSRSRRRFRAISTNQPFPLDQARRMLKSELWEGTVPARDTGTGGAS